MMFLLWPPWNFPCVKIVINHQTHYVQRKANRRRSLIMRRAHHLWQKGIKDSSWVVATNPNWVYPYPLTLEMMRTVQLQEQYICQRCEFTPSEGLLPLCCTCFYRRHICASFFKSLMLLSGPKPLAGREGARSVCGLRSNFHDVWMCSLISLINNHFPAPTIRSWGYWPWAQVTDLLP